MGMAVLVAAGHRPSDAFNLVKTRRGLAQPNSRQLEGLHAYAEGLRRG